MQMLSLNSSAGRTVSFIVWGVAVSKGPVSLGRLIHQEAAGVADSGMEVRALVSALRCAAWASFREVLSNRVASFKVLWCQAASEQGLGINVSG